MKRLISQILILLPVLALVLASCSGGRNAGDEKHVLPDTLRVATLYSPASYFLYRDEPMGYDYSLVSTLGQEKGMAIDLTVAPSLNRAIEMLDSGLVDLIAYEVPVTAEYKERVLACGPVNETTQVLVQPDGDDKITDVTELVGHDVYVVKDSKYQHRLENLNSELGGGIRIHTVDRDTIVTEDLIDMVADGEIPLTIVDSDIARINKTYYPRLDITMPVSFYQRSQWAVARDRQWLADSIDAWLDSEQPRQENADLLRRYFEMSKALPYGSEYSFDGGRMSAHDDLFRKYAPEIGWDWRMLSSQAFVESRYRNNAVSWAGARGLMQIMPRTARGYDVSVAALSNPDVSVRTAAKVIRDLDRMLAKKVPDPEERKKFILAAYNGGIAHVYDAIELAKKTGRDPQVWNGNVEEALMLKSNPKYYNDPVVKYGYFHGRETTNYVRRVMDFYSRAKKHVNA